MVNDERLMQRMQTGEQDALAELYDRHSSVVLGLLFKIVGNRNIAEEILQETFWRVWKNAASFDPEKGKFRTWMFSIARRLAIDKLRRRQRRPQSVEGERNEDELDRAPSEDDLAEDVYLAIQRAAVRDALVVLTVDQRLVIEMAYFQGKTRREIARETNIPLGTVHTRARVGLQRLQAELVKQGWGSEI